MSNNYDLNQYGYADNNSYGEQSLDLPQYQSPAYDNYNQGYNTSQIPVTVDEACDYYAPAGTSNNTSTTTMNTSYYGGYRDNSYDDCYSSSRRESSSSELDGNYGNSSYNSYGESGCDSLPETLFNLHLAGKLLLLTIF